MIETAGQLELAGVFARMYACKSMESNRAYFPQRASFRRRVSLELRNGTKTRPFLLLLPRALIQLARANKELHKPRLFNIVKNLHLHQ
jgi:hypothetical protein